MRFFPSNIEYQYRNGRLVTGGGELLGYDLRFVSGYVVDRTKAYWRQLDPSKTGFAVEDKFVFANWQ